MECTIIGHDPKGLHGDKCFLCNRYKISSEALGSVLEIQGLPDTLDERRNILQVLCQLLRVTWGALQGLFQESVSIPFCSGCLKSVIEMMSLREQLFQIESELRIKIGNIMSQVAQLLESAMNPFETFCAEQENTENESYEKYRNHFQMQVANEYAERRLLSSKVTEKILQGKEAVVLEPSLVQLNFEKNIFHVGNKVAIIENPIIPLEIFDIPIECEQDIGEDSIENEFSLGVVPHIDDEELINGKSSTSKVCIKRTEVDSRSVEDEQSIYDKDESEDFDSDSNHPLDEGSNSENQSDDSDEDVDEKSYEPSINPKRVKIPPKVLPNFKLKKKRASSLWNVKIDAHAAPRSRLVDANRVAMATYTAKDGTLWTNVVPSMKHKRRSKGPVEGGGVTGPAKDVHLSPVELFKVMFSPDMVDVMVTHTNAFASSTNDSKWRPLTRDEAYAFIGLLICIGAEKKRHTALTELWTHDPKYATPAIVATMSYNRFSQIHKFLRFDDRSQRQIAGGAQSKLDYISAIFEPFVKNIQACFCPYDTLVVDELLIRYSGTVKFRVNMKTTPRNKYGVKIWALCDAKTGYVLRLCIYEGKVRDVVEEVLGMKVVLGLVEPYFHTGRRVTTDNFLTSKSLGDELRNQNLTLLGMLNKTRMDVIPEFAEGRKRPLQSSMLAFQDHFTMVSYVQRNKKNVILLSTAHHDAKVNPWVRQKPQMILDYNTTKGGVDAADKMMQSLSCQRSARRWPVKLFQAICDIAAFNAFLLFKMRSVQESGQAPTQKAFLRSVAEALMKPILLERSLHENANQLPTFTKNAMSIMGFPVDVTPPMPPTNGKQGKEQGRCTFCPGAASKQKTARVRCDLCRLFACKTHSVIVRTCTVCAGGAQPNPPKRDEEPSGRFLCI